MYHFRMRGMFGDIITRRSRGRLNIGMPFYQYENSNYEDKTISRHRYLCNGKSFSSVKIVFISQIDYSINMDGGD